MYASKEVRRILGVIGKVGGYARAAKLTKARRLEISRMGSAAMKKKWGKA